MQTTLTRLYVHWPRVRRAGNPVGYARTSLTHAFVDEPRRAHRRRETPTDAGPRATPVARADADLAPGGAGRAGRAGPAAARGRRAPALARPRRRRDRPGARLLDRHRQVQNAKALDQLRTALEPAITPREELHDRPQRPARPRRRPGRRHPSTPHADLTRGRRALARTRRRRGAAGLVGSPPRVSWASGRSGTPPTTRRRSRAVGGRADDRPRSTPASRCWPSPSRPGPTRSTPRPRAGRCRARTRRRSRSRRSASPTRSPLSFVGQAGDPLRRQPAGRR